MEELNFLERLESVKAPPNFEQRVMAQLSLQKRARRRKMRTLRLSLAGAFTFVLIGFIVLNTLVLQKESPVAGIADIDKKSLPKSAEVRGPGVGGIIPITEAVDYRSEIRSRSYEPQTVYILEQVSDVTHTEIKY